VTTGAAARRKEHRGRSFARRLALQALYQMQLNPLPWQDAHNQFQSDAESSRADPHYFRVLLSEIAEAREALDASLAAWSEIAPHDLDPVEHAALWLGLHELRQHPEVPYRVVLAEAVDLAKRFGAADGHKFVNAVLDRAARELRAAEYRAGA
jgi:N utilization substance protein B